MAAGIGVRGELQPPVWMSLGVPAKPNRTVKVVPEYGEPSDTVTDYTSAIKLAKNWLYCGILQELCRRTHN